MIGRQVTVVVQVSIIIPVYNVEKYLEECLDSIWNQYNMQDITTEIIAVNDGSTDNSLYILQNAQKKHSCLEIISQNNCGQGAARNIGIQRAQGKYIYFLDADDCLTGDAISKCYKISEKNNLDVLLFDAYVFGELKEGLGIKDDTYMRKEVIGNCSNIMCGIEFLKKYYPVAYNPSACMVFTRRDFLSKNEITFPEGIYHEDIALHNKLLFYADRVQYVSDCLYKRRYRADSTVTAKPTKRKAEDLLRITAYSWEDALNIGEYQAICLKNTRILQNLLILWANTYSSIWGIEDLDYIKEGYALAGKIYGKTIEEWNCFCDINFIYNLYSIFDFAGIDNDVQISITEKRNRMLRDILIELPLGDEAMCVGIYGTGKMANRILEDYEKVVGSIKANIYFIDSNVGRNTKYKERPLININKLNDFQIDYILIASTKYEAVMRKNIKLLYGSRYEVICLADDYKL